MTCRACAAPMESGRFCPRCGADQRPDEQRETDSRIRGLLLAFGLVIGYILLLNWIELPRGPWWALFSDSCFFLAVGIFAWTQRRMLRPAFALDHLRWKDASIALGLQLALTAMVLVIAPLIVRDLGASMRDMTATYREGPWPYATALLSIAVFPALTEELAFRGILFGRLEQLMPRNATIIVSAAVFAWVHFSFISMLWLFPSGLLLGWLRAKHGTIWYGVLCHALHNAIVTIVDLSR